MVSPSRGNISMNFTIPSHRISTSWIIEHVFDSMVFIWCIEHKIDDLKSEMDDREDTQYEQFLRMCEAVENVATRIGECWCY